MIESHLTLYLSSIKISYQYFTISFNHLHYNWSANVNRLTCVFANGLVTVLKIFLIFYSIIHHFPLFIINIFNSNFWIFNKIKSFFFLSFSNLGFSFCWFSVFQRFYIYVFSMLNKIKSFVFFPFSNLENLGLYIS